MDLRVNRNPDDKYYGQLIVSKFVHQFVEKNFHDKCILSGADTYLFRGGIEVPETVKIEFDMNDDEVSYLENTKGVIVFEGYSGTDVEYFDDEAELIGNWEDYLEDAQTDRQLRRARKNDEL